MKLKVFQWTAGLAGIYHAILGVVGTFASTDLVNRVVHTVYGVQLEITGQVMYLVKFTSAYFIAFAVAMLLLAWKPFAYRNLVWVAVGLFATRLVDRILFFSGMREEFQFALAQEVFTVVTISSILVILVLLRPRTEQ